MKLLIFMGFEFPCEGACVGSLLRHGTLLANCGQIVGENTKPKQKVSNDVVRP